MVANSGAARAAAFSSTGIVDKHADVIKWVADVSGRLVRELITDAVELARNIAARVSRPFAAGSGSFSMLNKSFVRPLTSEALKLRLEAALYKHFKQ